MDQPLAYTRGKPQLTELSSVGWALCSTGLREFFLKIPSTCLPISWLVLYECTCPPHTEGAAAFDHKWHDPHAASSLFTRSCPKWLLFVSPDEKSPQREMFCQCGRGEQKNGRSTTRHQNRQVQKLFWVVEKHLNRWSVSNEEHFEGDWSLNM